MSERDRPTAISDQTLRAAMDLASWNETLRLVVVSLAVLAGAAIFPTVASSAASADSSGATARRGPCVGTDSGCFATLQEALDAAEPGATIRIGPGTYKGGVEIKRGVKLIGAGPKKTVIRGGGPVLTIGTFGAQTEPKVTIRGVKITGGLTRSSPMSVDFTGEKGVFAVGGGILIPPNADFDGGARVKIHNSVIAGNRVAPRVTVPSDNATCPGGHPCDFAFAGGGGIDSWGRLTLSRSVVRNNVVGGLSDLASDADGGGIASRLRELTLRRSKVNHNKATANAPIGRFAEGGGIYAPGGALTLRHSSVSQNRAILKAGLPGRVDLLAIGGGAQLAEVSAVRIANSRISHNVAKATNGRGPATAASGALNLVNIKARFHVTGSAMVDNEAIAFARNRSHGDASVDSGAGALAGSVLGTRIDGNSATARSRGGDATATSGAALTFGRMAQGSLVDNAVIASSPRGRARAGGGALHVDFKPLTLREMAVEGNTAIAHGERGSARGGAIFNAKLFSSGAPLTLIDTAVRGNDAVGNDAVKLMGGGVYAPERPVTNIRSAISSNTPDQCFGC